LRSPLLLWQDHYEKFWGTLSQKRVKKYPLLYVFASGMTKQK